MIPFLCTAIVVFIALRGFINWLLQSRAKFKRQWRSTMRLFRKLWLALNLTKQPTHFQRSNRGGKNRTSRAVEDLVLELQAQRPDLGFRAIQQLMWRIHDRQLSIATVRAISIRRADDNPFGRKPKTKPRIDVDTPMTLWGLDYTVVKWCGVWPIYLLGIVDYCGSRLVMVQRLRPTTEHLCRALDEAFSKLGTPARMMSDNGSQFTLHVFQAFLQQRGVAHTRTKPAHPWTNGRIERLFRTLKQEQRRYHRIFLSMRQIDGFCDEFYRFYNFCRPHSSFGAQTPSEAFTGKRFVGTPKKVLLFRGQLQAHEFK
jgi:putative transposase